MARLSGKAWLSGSLLALALFGASASSSASGGTEDSLGEPAELPVLDGAWSEQCSEAAGAESSCPGGWHLRFGRAAQGPQTFSSRFGECGELGNDLSLGKFDQGSRALTLFDCLHGETIDGLFDSHQREFGYAMADGGQRLILTADDGSLRVFRRDP